MPIPRFISFIVTSKCNIECKYCYLPKQYKHNIKSVKIKSVKKVISIIKKISENTKKELISTILITGGEPLLETDKIKEIINVISPIRKKIKLLLNTNGTLIKEKHIPFLKQFDKIIISVDGNKESHNKTRDNSYNKVKKGINICKKTKNENPNLELNISKTISSHNNSSISQDIIDIYEKFKLPLNLIIAKNDYSWNKERYNKAKEEFEKLYEYISKFNKEEKIKYFSNFFTIPIMFCPFTKITINSEKVYNCEILATNSSKSIGTINDYMKKYMACEYNPLNERCINEYCLECDNWCDKKCVKKDINNKNDKENYYFKALNLINIIISYEIKKLNKKIRDILIIGTKKESIGQAYAVFKSIKDFNLIDKKYNLKKLKNTKGFINNKENNLTKELTINLDDENIKLINNKSIWLYEQAICLFDLIKE